MGSSCCGACGVLCGVVRRLDAGVYTRFCGDRGHKINNRRHRSIAALTVRVTAEDGSISRAGGCTAVASSPVVGLLRLHSTQQECCVAEHTWPSVITCTCLGRAIRCLGVRVRVTKSEFDFCLSWIRDGSTAGLGRGPGCGGIWLRAHSSTGCVVGQRVLLRLRVGRVSVACAVHEQRAVYKPVQ